MRWLSHPQGAASPEVNGPHQHADGETSAAQAVEISDLGPAIAEERRQPHDHMPWVMLNMVASVDGATAGSDNRSRQLSGPADREMFRTLRAIADVVLAGASTMRIEKYGTPRLSSEAVQLRSDRGQPDLPRLALVSRSLDLDPASRLFGEATPAQPPIVLTTAAGADRAPADLRKQAAIRAVGKDRVDWREALRLLHDEFEAKVVLVEGGPTVNEQLVQEDLVDELCLSVAPLLVGGHAPRIVLGGSWEPRALRLDRIITSDSDGFVFLRYLRVRD